MSSDDHQMSLAGVYVRRKGRVSQGVYPEGGVSIRGGGGGGRDVQGARVSQGSRGMSKEASIPEGRGELNLFHECRNKERNEDIRLTCISYWTQAFGTYHKSHADYDGRECMER